MRAFEGDVIAFRTGIDGANERAERVLDQIVLVVVEALPAGNDERRRDL